MKGRSRLGFGLVLVALLAVAMLPVARAQEGDTLEPGAGITAMADTLNLQGRLLTSGGAAVTPGNYEMRFYICDASTCATTVWGPQISTVAVDGSGLFSALLSGLTADVFSGDRWLRIEVCTNPQPDPCQGWDTLSPQPISSVALAVGNIRKNVADSTTASAGVSVLSVTNTGPGGGLRATANHADVAALEGENLYGYGVVGRSSGADYAGVYGENSTGAGVWGTSSGPGVKAQGSPGLLAESSATAGVSASGVTYGVYASASTGTGVRGFSANGYGLQGVSTNNDGVRGESTYGYAVYGTSVHGEGVYGLASGPEMAGVHGYGEEGYGVLGGSSSGNGVKGTSTSGYGVYGTSTTSSTAGVFGSNSAGTGVRGEGLYGVRGVGGDEGVRGTGSMAGVRGDSSTGYAVYGIGSSPNHAAVLGENYSGTGVSGIGGTGDGVYGFSMAGDKAGVYGSNSTGTGVRGEGLYGVRGVGGDEGVRGTGSMAGVRGDSSTGYAVYGIGSSPNHAAVLGENYSGTGMSGIGGTGDGVYGFSMAGDKAGVHGENVGGAGVKGESTNGAGVYGTSTDSYGVYGTISRNTGAAVYGYASANTSAAFAWGVEGLAYGTSATNAAIGVYGHSEGRDTGSIGTGVYGKSVSDGGFGVAGHNFWGGAGVGAWSYSGDLYRGYSGDYPAGALRFYVTNSGYGYFDAGYGTFTEVPTPDGQGTEHRNLHGTTSPESWSEDFGTGTLVNGEARIEIEAIWAQTVNLDAGYRVFFTPLGDCNGLYVAEKGPTYFVVRELQGGQSNVEFDYRIIAHPLGQESGRLEVIPAETFTSGLPSPARETTP